MVPIRAFLNVAQAELAKSLLDDHGIFCAVAHENAHLYGGSPFAMPIQLLVDESQAGQAIQILDGRVETATDIETSAPEAFSLSEEETRGVLAKDNPWELLVMAALFLFPGIYVTQIKYPVVIESADRARYLSVLLSVMHFFGWLAVAFAGCLVIGYLWSRWSVTVGYKPRPFPNGDGD